MEQNFALMFEVVRHERSLLLIISLTDPDILRGEKFTDYKVDNIKKISFRETTSKALFERTRSHVFIRIAKKDLF